MKLSKLKELVQKLEAESAGTDTEVQFYDLTLPASASNYELAFKDNEFPVSTMRVGNIFVIPLFPIE